MLKTIPLILAVFFTIATQAQSFKSQQQKYPRYRQAAKNVRSECEHILTSKNLDKNSLRLFIKVHKQEEQLQLWGKDKNHSKYVLLKEYPFCYASGSLGPKRKQGDGQVPEGFYFIDRFNPYSNFHLSLGINYPNQSDRIKGRRPLGGDIFIHGNCVSIGCIAITDPIIEEVYYFAVEGKNNGQAKIPVYIFPFKMNQKNMDKYSKEYLQQKEFWRGLKPVYDFFEKNRNLPVIGVKKNGSYYMKQ